MISLLKLAVWYKIAYNHLNLQVRQNIFSLV